MKRALRPSVIGLGLIVMAFSGACSKGKPADHGDVSQIRLAEHAVIATDLVGHDEWEQRATFALVDADNLSTGELVVTLSGLLVDANGGTVGSLRPESLRIPPGGKRTFALVDSENAERPGAVAAKVEVRGAVVPRWQPTVRISDGHVFDDRGKVMIAASITNQADRPGKTIIFAGFHDADGQPMERQHVVLEMGPEMTQTVRFVGPQGSKTGYLFLGDASY